METKERNYFVLQDGGVPIKAWIRDVELEDEARQQLTNISRMPFVYKHLAVMPDVHAGKGATIGSVIATRGAIIPAAVGVDIGCGMQAVKLGYKISELPDNLNKIRSAIEARVPHGRTDNGGRNDKGARHSGPDSFDDGLIAYLWNRDFATGLAAVASNHPDLLKGNVNTFAHMATLGTGNHFIELCTDENDDLWIMLHSGSRGIGNRIGTYFIELAKKDMKRWFINLPDQDLAYIPEGSTLFADYMKALSWAQKFAQANRAIMLWMVLDTIEKIAFGKEEPVYSSDAVKGQVISCHHNYVSHENHFGSDVLVTRKGAVSAKAGELGIIPGSMGVGSYIVRGKGERESFCSCSHGAGRRMSRTKARNTISLEEHAQDTAHVECRKDVDVLDESPRAYKDLGAVMAAQSDLVDIVHKLTPLICIKG